MAGDKVGVPVVNVFDRYHNYELQNNCLNQHGGLLTGRGVHPYTPQGALILADAHAEGLLKVL